MIPRILLTLLFCLTATGVPADTAKKDERLQPISRELLVTLIQRTPLSSPLHDTLIVRAYSSGLFAEACQQYTLRWNQNPNSVRANLLRGSVALKYWTIGRQRNFLLGSPLRTQLEETARSCLRRALEMAPDSVEANREYGYYLWQFGYELDRGMALLKKAAALAPNDPKTLMCLGDVYSNPSAKKTYDPKQAEMVLKKAIQLDPAYVPPRFILAQLYWNTNRREESKRERQAWMDLIPKEADPKKVIKIY